MSETQIIKTEEQIKEEHNKYVNEVIEKVSTKNFKIYFYCIICRTQNNMIKDSLHEGCRFNIEKLHERGGKCGCN